MIILHLILAIGFITLSSCVTIEKKEVLSKEDIAENLILLLLVKNGECVERSIVIQTRHTEPVQLFKSNQSENGDMWFDCPLGHPIVSRDELKQRKPVSKK